jgi:hypothetical protein
MMVGTSLIFAEKMDAPSVPHLVAHKSLHSWNCMLAQEQITPSFMNKRSEKINIST